MWVYVQQVYSLTPDKSQGWFTVTREKAQTKPVFVLERSSLVLGSVLCLDYISPLTFCLKERKKRVRQ